MPEQCESEIDEKRTPAGVLQRDAENQKAKNKLGEHLHGYAKQTFLAHYMKHSDVLNGNAKRSHHVGQFIGESWIQ